MKKLIIVGAGGFGREVLKYAQDLRKQSPDFEIAGFIDDNPEALIGYNYDLKIIGSIHTYEPKENDIFVLGIESPQKKLEIGEKLIAKNASFMSLIHPSAEISNNVTIGKGCVLCPHSGVSCDVKIGDFVTLNAHAAIGHDAVISDGCTLSSFSMVSGSAILGRGVYIGIHGCILPKIRVAEFARIGAGSVVHKSVRANSTVIGVPAKKIL